MGRGKHGATQVNGGRPDISDAVYEVSITDIKADRQTDEADRKRGGKTGSGSGQVWSSPSPRGQWRTGGKKWRKLVVKSYVVPQRPPRLLMDR